MSKPLLNKLKIQNDEISDIITSFDLRAVECGEILTDTNDSHGEVFSHYFRINYIEDGKAYYRYEGRTIELETGSVAFLEPNVTLSVDEGKPVKILFVNFEIKAIDKRNLFIKEMNVAIPFLHIHDEDNVIHTIMHIILKLAKENKTGAGLEIQNNFLNLIVRLVRQNGSHHHDLLNKPSNRADDLFNDAVKYINENIGRNFKLAELAEYLNISNNYLYKIFTAHIGKSPSEFTADMRIDIAKSYLSNPNIQIKSIAANLGYDTVAHFSRAFKRMTGMSPGEYRKQTVNRLKEKIKREAELHGNI